MRPIPTPPKLKVNDFDNAGNDKKWKPVSFYPFPIPPLTPSLRGVRFYLKSHTNKQTIRGRPMLKGQSANVTRDKIPKPKIPPEPQKRKSDLAAVHL